MAEGAVTFLLDKLTPILEQEIRKLLGGLGREFIYIKDELRSMKAFLRVADARSESDELVKEWVNQVRDVCHDTEDIIDEFVLRLSQPSIEARRGTRSFFIVLHKITHFLSHAKYQRRIAKQIQDIKARVDEISERRLRYGFEQSMNSNSQPTWYDPRGRALLLDESELVSIDGPREEVLDLLIKGDSRTRVVSVVGTGGLGKTTLVKKAYDDPKAKDYFHHHAWITVSQCLRIEELLRELISQLFEEVKHPVPEGVETMKDGKLKEIINKFLHEKRYVIVFDDIWSLDAWDALKYALPDCKCGSRIVITTRSTEISHSCVATYDYGYVYEHQPLNEKDSWTLFCNNAFRSNPEKHCPKELESLSQSILRKCEGLPLAIVAIGGLLSTKEKTGVEWEHVLRGIGSELGSNNKLHHVKNILSLSYIDLPYYLKSCFLYFGIFPEDYCIEPTRLIRLWCAEGFVEVRKGSTMEEVAESYFYELISRNLIQIANTRRARIRMCRVHDLMRGIIVSKSVEERFVTVVDEKSQMLHEKTRRLSVIGDCENVSLMKNLSHVRSMFMFGVDMLPNSFKHSNFGGFMLLKVLELKGCPLEVFPNETVNLMHLRYLGLRDTKIKMLPTSISKLQKLETLDLKHTLASDLPPGILKLKNLRHLLFYRYDVGSHATFGSWKGFTGLVGIGDMLSLQKLCHMEPNQDKRVVRELGKLKDLRRLGIIKLRKEQGNDLCSSIEKMRKLRSLTVNSIEEGEILDLQSLCSPPPLLQKLFMQGRLEKLPSWISSLNNLVSMSLSWSRLTDDPIKALQDLPNLVDLKLRRAYDGDLLCFRTGTFLKLKFLFLNNLNALRRLIVEEGAMPLLHSLEMRRCVALKEVPLGIKDLSNLKKLWFYDMPDQLKMQLLPTEEDHWKVSHVEDVLFCYWTDKGWKKYRHMCSCCKKKVKT